MLLSTRVAAAVLVAIFIATAAGHAQTPNNPDADTRTKTAAPYEPYSLETVIVGGPENLHPMICGLDMAPKRIPEVACSNGEAIQFFRYAPMTAVWGVPVGLVGHAKGRGRCPRGFRSHKDDTGATWCMDSEGRSYTPENARYVAKH